MKLILTICFLLTSLTTFSQAPTRLFSDLGGPGREQFAWNHADYQLIAPPWVTVTELIADPITSLVAVGYAVQVNTDGLKREGFIQYTNGGGTQYIGLYQHGKATVTSAPSYKDDRITSGSIATIFGRELAVGVYHATNTTYYLGGTTITFIAEDRSKYECQLLYVSPTQVNFILPPNVKGISTIVAGSNTGNTASGQFSVVDVGPDLFSIDATGTGAAAGTVQRNHFNGQVSYSPLVAATMVDLSGTQEEPFLLLYGTGIREQKIEIPDTATIGDIPVEVMYAGNQFQFVGLDQVTLRLPRSLIGRGNLPVTVTIDGKVSNTVWVMFK